MRWKKGIITLWLLFGISGLVTAFLLISARTGDTETPRQTETLTTLDVYAWNDEIETFDALAAGFMEKYENIQINMHYFPNSENLQSYQIALNGDDNVDVIALATAAGAAQLINKGQLAPLDELLADSEADFSGLELLMDSLKQGGQTWMIPYRNSAWVVYYNKTIFDAMEIPYPEGEWTWSEYADLAEQLTNPNTGWYGSLNFESNWWRVPARTAGAEDPLQEEDLAFFMQAAEWSYDLTWNRGAAIPFTNLTSADSKDYIGRFLSGEAAMMFCGEWCLSTLNERIEEEQLDFSYDVAPLPSWTEDKSYAIGSAAVLMLAEKSAHKELALLFLEYACGEEGAKLLAEKHFLPAWDSAQIRQIFQNSLDMPAHSDCFFPDKELSSFPPTTDYTIAINVLHDNIWTYLTREVSLQTAIENYRTQLAERLASQ